MAREIDVLLEADEQGWLVIEKESNVLWDRGELLVAQQAGRYCQEASMSPPRELVTVNGPFPGCLQGGAEDHTYQARGETEHFVIFSTDS